VAPPVGPSQDGLGRRARLSKLKLDAEERLLDRRLAPQLTRRALEQDGPLVSDVEPVSRLAENLRHGLDEERREPLRGFEDPRIVEHILPGADQRSRCRRTLLTRSVAYPVTNSFAARWVTPPTPRRGRWSSARCVAPASRAPDPAQATKPCPDHKGSSKFSAPLPPPTVTVGPVRNPSFWRASAVACQMPIVLFQIRTTTRQKEEPSC
jgi:hypothetical protein